MVIPLNSSSSFRFGVLFLSTYFADRKAFSAADLAAAWACIYRALSKALDMELAIGTTMELAVSTDSAAIISSVLFNAAVDVDVVVTAGTVFGLMVAKVVLTGGATSTGGTGSVSTDIPAKLFQELRSLDSSAPKTVADVEGSGTGETSEGKSDGLSEGLSDSGASLMGIASTVFVSTALG